MDSPATAEPSGHEIAIEVVTDQPGLLSLREEWDRLLAEDARASVFASWEWSYHWWCHYGKDRALRVLCAREGGRLVGVLPLHVQAASAYRRSLRLLRLVCTGGDTSPDDLDPPLAPASAERCAAAFARFVLEELGGWDVLVLSDLDPGRPLWAAFAAECRRRRAPWTDTLCARMAYIELPPSWDAYLAALHRDRRYTIRSTRKKLEAQQGRFEVHAAEDSVDTVLEELIRLHHRRWQSRGERHAFATPEYVGFHRDAIHACARRGWIRFYRIAAGGVPVAIFYCYSFRGRVSYFQAGFDPDYERLRPGLVLIGYAVEHAIREGASTFDFLRGDHEYKSQWGKSSRETRTLTAYRRSAGAALYRLHEERVPAVKRLIKRLLPFLRRPGQEGHGARRQTDNA